MSAGLTPAWSAWNRVGYFGAGVIATDGEVGTGATPSDPVTVDRITLDAFPANMFAGVDEVSPTPDKPAVGRGQRLILDPDGSAGGPYEVTIENFLLDPALTIIFRDPLVLEEAIPDSEDVGFPSPTHLYVAQVPRIQVIAEVPIVDDRGNDVNLTDLNLDVVVEMTEDSDQDLWHTPSGLVLPAEINLMDAIPAAPPTRVPRLMSAILEIPPLPYIRFPVNGGTDGAVFSLRATPIYQR